MTATVTGTVALMANRDYTLPYYPDVVKGILMTTAINRLGLPNKSATDPSNDIRGAGSLSTDGAARLAQIVGNRKYSYIRSTNTSASPMLGQFVAAKGEVVRAAVVWSTYDWSDYPNRPHMDLDFQVIAPSGALVAGGYKWEQNAEMVEFTASEAGTYTVKVYAYRYSLDPIYSSGFAMVWNNSAK